MHNCNSNCSKSPFSAARKPSPLLVSKSATQYPRMTKEQKQNPPSERRARQLEDLIEENMVLSQQIGEYQDALQQIKANEDRVLLFINDLELQCKQLESENKILKQQINLVHHSSQDTRSFQTRQTAQETYYQTKLNYDFSQFQLDPHKQVDNTKQLDFTRQLDNSKQRSVEPDKSRHLSDHLQQSEAHYRKLNEDLQLQNLQLKATVENLTLQLQQLERQRQLGLRDNLQKQINEQHHQDKIKLLDENAKLELENTQLLQESVLVKQQLSVLQKKHQNLQHLHADICQQLQNSLDRESEQQKRHQTSQQVLHFQTSLKQQLLQKSEQLFQAEEMLREVTLLNSQLEQQNKRLAEENQQLKSSQVMYQSNMQGIIKEAVKLSPQKIVIKTVN